MLRPQLVLLILVFGGLAALPTACGSHSVAATSATTPSELLAFVTEKDRDLAVVRADGTGIRYLTRREATATPSASCALSPAWSPDRRWIAFTGCDGVFVVRADGTGLRRLGAGGDPSWAPDSRHIVYVDLSRSPDPATPPKPAEGDALNSGLRAGAITIASLHGDIRRIAVGTSPTWSPDGHAVAFMRYGLTPYHLSGSDWTNLVHSSTLTLVHPDGTHGRVLFQESTGERAVYAPQWSPDASTLAVVQAVPDARSGDFSLRLATMNATTGRTRHYLAVDTHVQLQTGAVGQGFAWAPDSERILVAVYRSSGTRLALAAVRTTSSRLLGSSQYGIGGVAWSPDGSRIAYITCSNDSPPPFTSTPCTLMTAGADGTRASRVAGAPRPGPYGLSWSTGARAP